MELIDTHCHLTFEQLIGDIEGVLDRSRAAGVTGWVTVGTDAQHNVQAVELAERYDQLYAAIGVHPHDAKDVTPDTLKQLRDMAQNVRVCAIGETGLDFHYNFSKRPDQLRVFSAQLQIAQEFNLPVIVHCRNAFDETMDTLERFGRGVKGVVLHCFSGSPEQAKRVLEFGCHISFTGVVTFKSADQTRRAAEAVPVDRLMLETDCPYMSPAPMRKQKINEPALMVHTAEFMAELKGMSLPTFAAEVTKTSKAFFGIP